MKKLSVITMAVALGVAAWAPGVAQAQGPYYPGYESGISFGSDGYNYITSRQYARDNYNYNRGNYYSQGGGYNNSYNKPRPRRQSLRLPDNGSYYYRGYNPGRYDNNLYSGTWDRGGGVSQAYRY